MLKMKCPKCEEMIVSALLSDIEKIPCEHCKEVVPVTNVMVFAEGFTFHRNDLIKRMFRYKTLLMEIRKEREMLDKNPEASAEGKRSLERFAQALAEVMAGARNNLRIDFSSPVPVKFRAGQQSGEGQLINLSMSGACLEIKRQLISPKKKMPIQIGFTLPGTERQFTLKGFVSWVKKGSSLGVEFAELPADVQEQLWTFISSAVEN
ncbi:PilZ domain-containing protein [Malonomonas rubra DSM 5091]|uniref:PilZ domain-containing protein n=1 Tax=Malonomonas rubra DSM 5091 TaxID=1122189 RepID=A0A1M6NC51_MALRU|nr:PilZ domain-containing protein [Malonomonas rubra]SHJ93213.1 PilZ domain-containing protein [Malonomonas rubra DSM 5091]